MKKLLFAGFVGCFMYLSALSQSVPPLLRVSADGHRLVSQKGPNNSESPFFWLGDTAWNLFARLDKTETLRYLDDRAKKQFTVIQAHLLPWAMDSTNTENQAAFVNSDFDQPNETYWQHIDFVVREATKRGLYLAVLPAWGRTYIEPAPDGKTPVLHSDSLKAHRYGQFLGKRYRAYSNLIWVLGGDRKPTRNAIYRHLANGLTATYADGKPDRILITFHPPGGTYRPPATSSGEFFHKEAWLDFNMIQSGHALDNASYERISEDYARRPAKPTLDAEPCYEGHPVKHDYKNGLFKAWDVRRRGYWSLLAGAAGFTYGGNGIWQMDKPGKARKDSHFKDYWYDALNYEGGQQMQHLRRLAETYNWATWIPDSILLSVPVGRVDDRIQSVRTTDGRLFLHYTTNGRPIPLAPLPKGRWSYGWFDPRTGVIGPQKRVESMQFTPPTAGAGADWVLVLTRE